MSNDISDEDRQLFQQFAGKVKTVSHDKVVHEKKKPSPKARQRERDEQQVMSDIFSDDYEPHDCDNGDALYFAKEGLQAKLIKKFRQGKLSTQAVLDLHHMTSAEARVSLAEFLSYSQSRHYRCVRIIHGKGNHSAGGKPVIKNKLNRWLRQWDDVLAFCTARNVDGGTGALYVLLKRSS